MSSVPLPIRLPRNHRRALNLVFFGVWLSGGLWLLFHHFLAVPSPFGPTPHPLEKWWLRLHGGFAFATLVVMGSVLPVHARGAWQRQRNRITGLMMQAWLVWLAATGYALYYFSSEANEAWLPLLHWIAGLALPLMLTLHVKRGRARAAARVANAAPPASARAAAETP
ncbi:hypothetical protein [Thiobacter aerophilum]|uniref:Transmembrane protein n=1 Tax=Thiobacter aerophilum TaxID=3121275 RepID=A0ABV0EIQ9_9BURK